MPCNRARRSVAASLMTVALLVVPMACSDSSTQGQSTPSATAAPAPTGTSTTGDCAAVTDLKASLQTLTNVKPLQDGLTALNNAMAGVKSSLVGAAASASAALQPAVASVKAAFSDVETAASGLTAENFREKAPAINTALRQVGTAASSFATTLTQTCPGS